VFGLFRLIKCIIELFCENKKKDCVVCTLMDFLFPIQNGATEL
jgi:hypothetical protein